MITIDNTPDGMANAAMAHLLLGMMKSDGKVTLQEEIRMDDLMDRLSGQLPGDPDAVSDLVTELLADVDYGTWAPQNHLERGLDYFGQLADTGEAYQGHVDGLLDLLRQLMEVDDVTATEREYLRRASQEFGQRFG